MKSLWVLIATAAVAAAVAPAPSPSPLAAPVPAQASAPAPAAMTVEDVAPELARSAVRVQKFADEAEKWADAAKEASKAVAAAWHAEHPKAVSFQADPQDQDLAQTPVNTTGELVGQANGGPSASRAKDELWLRDVESAGRLKRLVTFPVGDWFLGVGDGGIGRDKDNPAKGALIMKGSLSDFENTRPPGPGNSDEYKETHEPPAGGWTDNARSGVSHLPIAGYGGELQLLEDFRSQTIRFSDLTDTSRFSCQHSAWGPGPGGPAPVPNLQGYPHPQIELDHPESFVHVHLEDKSAGPTPHVLWDAAYDMGGTEVLKSTAPAMWGTRQNMELFCPPKHGPPHWFELTISREANARRRPFMMQDFIASQVLSAYRPDQDPQLDAFSMAVDSGIAANAAKASFL